MRQAQQAQRAAERAAAAASRDAKARHIASRRDEAERKTAEVEQWVTVLSRLLAEGIRRPARVDLRRFKRTLRSTAFDPGELENPAQRPAWSQFEPAEPGMLSTLFGGRERHQTAVARARRRFDEATTRWEQQEHQRTQRLARARAAFDARKAKSVLSARSTTIRSMRRSPR
jgi:restriction system protein